MWLKPTSDGSSCFGRGLRELVAGRGWSGEDLLSRARELHEKTGFSMHRKVMLSGISFFEDLLCVNVLIILQCEWKKMLGGS